MNFIFHVQSLAESIIIEHNLVIRYRKLDNSNKLLSGSRKALRQRIFYMKYLIARAIFRGLNRLTIKFGDYLVMIQK